MRSKIALLRIIQGLTCLILAITNIGKDFVSNNSL